MNLRPARAVDAPELVEIVESRHPEMRYAGEVEVDTEYARKLFAQSAFRHGGTNDGATFLMVAEGDRDRIEAFLLGSLGRVYGIGKKLAACDNYLIGRKDCDPMFMARALSGLVDLYVGWAEANPRVYEIGGSWSDALPGAERMGPFLSRKGFVKCGEIWRRGRAQAEVQGEAA